ncbi:bifunctional 23S rRNA (guanine(2069)-N(7))-methyltransferase RlmK/23S rRNA (guanine(2445)-N(2))-methyltransferase RlmL [Natronospira bacteriovora]|uniref:Ribosomal RNA large subunit methyltransferase K/L n=1 Tax=Natronospira bacteriovora TaxID=3069753 RepID=A0ABU0W836_9GAMM|nr:bifunctional 23S rRNA (guanine(2069)-N(7))-methyltransferase RlmK/23S rRNA (guanine(2445)-N(2))-methyltransferase RlmL [Natronospira sp. AB-CW4]MDQ2069625.1 bifunctional 23S rRNA (guanine(2069)-N(7))-methyltransferase RlmK/23S rRNA (guanine(2445)-N(2))-methyltransferase RlmL [Natronospira sp. AB-CW4]
MEVNFLCPPHCGPWLEKELAALGITVSQRAGRLIAGEGELAAIYRACLYSRVAARILVPIAEGPAHSDETLMQTLTDIDWAGQMIDGDSLAIDFRGTGGWINHSRFGRQRVKDGIVDSLRAAGREHPPLKPEAPDLLVFAHFDGQRIRLYRDLGAGPLHQRGYRKQAGGAPIKENLAAALLMAAGWPEHEHLLDPFCGSGTLVIEAALMKGGIAPGLYRRRWGFRGWPAHEAAEWQRQKSHARSELEQLDLSDCRLAGYDHDPAAITAARANAAAAGLEDWLIFTRREMAELKAPPGTESGLVISNPPYGERLEEREDLPALFTLLGERLRGPLKGWRYALLATEPDLLRHTGLDRRREYRFRNGPLDCKLVELWPPPPREGRDMENRLLKNLKHLRRWARREETDAFRVYDADIPEFALAVDCYGEHALVQEYAPPREIPADKAERRLAAGVAAVARALEIPGENIHLRTRRPQKGREQYTRLGNRGLELTVQEGPARFIVNLSDYTDSGLFLDHRPVRRWIRERAEGQRFLNLFAYTATATVHAALGGAAHTTSVDLNRNYLAWGQRNLALNGFDGDNHAFVRADCLEWLKQQKQQWDLILLDPPTFSNSSRMDDTLDIQRDHPALIRHALQVLAPGGLLIFSCNRRDFRLQLDDDGLQVQDMTARSIPEDFKRNQRIHHCWFISKAEKV